jgi:cytochrome c-type biogenesis protein CcmH/NrfG
MEVQNYTDVLPIWSVATMHCMMEVIMAFLLARLRISNSLTQTESHWFTARVLWVLWLLVTLNSVFYATYARASGSDCDRLASIAADPNHQATPVTYAEIDGSSVISACGQALSQDPDNGRYWVQLGRGYLKREQGEAMLDAFQRAQSLGYSAAWFALAVVYHTGNGIVEADLHRAELLYKEAFQQGVGHAALGLARLYDEPGSPFFDRVKSDLWQSRFDALINQLE